jgi:hypothetical protein
LNEDFKEAKKLVPLNKDFKEARKLLGSLYLIEFFPRTTWAFKDPFNIESQDRTLKLNSP